MRTGIGVDEVSKRVCEGQLIGKHNGGFGRHCHCHIQQGAVDCQVARLVCGDVPFPLSTYA